LFSSSGLFGFDDAFWVVLTGVLAASSCALLGTFLVLRRMSLLGDALSHAVLPGIAIAFFLSESRGIVPMFIGAAAFGLITTLLVEAFHRRWKVQEDASIGVVFTALFALGVVLITAYAGQVDLDQECVLYGEIAYTPWDTLSWNGTVIGPRAVWILSAVLLLNILFVGLCYKELVAASFDPAMAVSVGISASLVHYLLMGAVSLTTVAAFESVGAILVVAMLIVPGAAAYLWSDRLRPILALSVIFGAGAAIGGYFVATWWDSSISGAIVVVLGGVFVMSVLLAPKQGIVARLWQRLQLSLTVGQDHILLGMVRRSETGGIPTWNPQDMETVAAIWPPLARHAVRQLLRERCLVAVAGGAELTRAGEQRALHLLRSHRLWETYMSELGLPADHVHDPADAVEHFIDDQLQRELDLEISRRGTDPQGKEIPPRL
jgi:manganese/zinc/iron transport system permease protein